MLTEENGRDTFPKFNLVAICRLISVKGFVEAGAMFLKTTTSKKKKSGKLTRVKKEKTCQIKYLPK
jgi:hypothetical protein